MGWNCPACGYLLRPNGEEIEDRIRRYDCDHCGSKFLIIAGKPPRIYLNSLVVCIDD